VAVDRRHFYMHALMPLCNERNSANDHKHGIGSCCCCCCCSTPFPLFVFDEADPAARAAKREAGARRDGKQRIMAEGVGVRPLHVLLVLMVKNEARIIERCLEAAAPFSDAVLLADTGSTDDTVALAEAFKGAPLKVSHHVWKNFGASRTESLQAARAYAAELGWQLQDTYGLVLDGDMRLRGDPAALRAFLAAGDRAVGWHLMQRNGSSEYVNVRLMRLDDGWHCVGVTHEYWGGQRGDITQVPAQVAWIDDVGDGGAKDDKFERDERLLLAGLQAEPRNERYMFYLAQTYHCLNRHEQAVEWYKKRIEAGGWYEEVWYSHYMLTCNYLRLNKLPEAELWAQKGLELVADRPEALMQLVGHLRERGEHFKAWHYLLKVEGMRRPADARLFLEPDCYTTKPAYERSILHYYVRPQAKEDGSMLCLAYEGGCHEGNVLQNLIHYAERLPALTERRLEFPTPPGYKSSSVAAASDGTLCVRTVSYTITPEGHYIMPNGLVETRNFESSWCPRKRTWSGWWEALPDAASADAWRRDDYIRGLEDVRLCDGVFTATTREYSYCGANRMVHGTYPDMKFRPVRPPHGETDCEKNWLPLDCNRVLYGWHPLVIGEVREAEDRSGPSELHVLKSVDTPKWFRHLRGSAPPFLLDGQLWALAHVVAPHAPRHYLHLWVVLDAKSFRPVAYTAPFWLHHQGIEYCIGAQAWCQPDDAAPRSIQLFLSVWDRETWLLELSIDECRKRLRPV
jgi:tetratricopeptide (TPR) repeat protein